MLVQSGPWDNGVLLQAGSYGGTGLKVDGNWSHAGIHMQNNDLRLGRGARLVFEDAEGGDVALTFNADLKRLELSRTPSLGRS